MPINPAISNVLLDRDGTVIEDRHYLSDPGQVRLVPGTAAGLYALTRAGIRLFLVTNQSGVGRGLFSASDYEQVQARLRILLADQGILMHGEAACFHAPSAQCECRKPRTGMWSELSKRFGLKANESVMIGDKGADIDFARNAGLRASILVRTGYGAGEALQFREQKGQQAGDAALPQGHPCRILPDLQAACVWLMEQLVATS